MNTIDRILIGCAIFLTAFIVTMIVLFCIFQSVPDVLIECVMQIFTGEIFLTFLIWWIKRKGQNNGHKKQADE